MNPYIQNLNRIEFLITLACTGRCKHCSEGEHVNCGDYIDGDIATQVVYQVAEKYNIQSLMTFGGEPLLRPEAVCKIQRAALDCGIPKRQLITNGFFSKDAKRIEAVAKELAKSGVNAIALSVDAFHQETIPLEPVKIFAKAVQAEGISLCTHPAWLVSKEAENPYNQRTREILEEFDLMGITPSEGNVIFPGGNALKYLKEYFDLSQKQVSPYEENPEDVRAICIEPDGKVLGGNIYRTGIMDILAGYAPKK
ncbi:MAG: radical SAM protein [Lachnospiraceae bacterium]|nr:radical SAM protein [Lachnospiraceae bacterium]